MENVLSTLQTLCVTAGSKIVLALLIFIIGRIVIDRLLRILQNVKAFGKADPTVRSFLLNFCKVGLYVVLVISIINVLGVPMASVVTVLASAGVAVGMALQGSLSNLAGGIMLLIFRPFGVGDYISAAGEEGNVKEITLFYTILITLDNKRITIPNGALMNANVTNFSSEPTRRVDLIFSSGKGEDIQKIRGLMLDVIGKNTQIHTDPAPFVEFSGGTNESMEFTVRAWTTNAEYWDVYFALTRDITEALGAAGVKAPAARVIMENR